MNAETTYYYELERLSNFGRGGSETWLATRTYYGQEEKAKALKYRDEANVLYPGAWRVIERIDQQQEVTYVEKQWTTTKREVIG